jgi:hypothetical protein
MLSLIKYHNLYLRKTMMVFGLAKRYRYLFTLIYWKKLLIEFASVHCTGTKYPVIMKIFMDTSSPARYSADRKNRSEHIRRYPQTAVDNA